MIITQGFGYEGNILVSNTIVLNITIEDITENDIEISINDIEISIDTCTES